MNETPAGSGTVPPSPSTPIGRPRRRRCLRTIVGLAAALALLELLSFAALQLLADVPVTEAWRRAAAAEPDGADATATAGLPEIRAAAPSEAPAAAPTDAAAIAAAQDIHALLAIHPFLGFVYDPRRTTPRMAAYLGSGVSDWGFLDGGSPLRRRSPDTLIVGITGGSVAYGLTREGEDVLRDELRRLPALAGREPVFVHLALLAWKQPQQLMALSYLLSLGAEFDVLVNLDGFNEIALPRSHNVYRGVNPFFPNAWDIVLGDVPDAPSRRLLGELSLLRELRASWAATCSRSVLRHFRTEQLVWLVGDRILGRAEASSARDLSGVRPAAGLGYAAAGPPSPHATDRELFEDCVAMWARSSTLMRRLCEANGIVYAHALQPNQYVPGSKPMGEEERRVAVDPAAPYALCVIDGYPLLVAAGRALAAEGELFADLTSVFASVEEPVYVDTSCHVNARGNEILARELAALVARGLPSSR